MKKVRVIPMPNAQGEFYIVQIQFTDGGVIFTNSNDGKGYTLEEANVIASEIRSSFTP